MSLHVNRGPANGDVLFYGTEHRSFKVFNNPSSERDILLVRRGDQKLWHHIKTRGGLDGRIKEVLNRVGLGGLIEVGYRKVDRALITALVELWRPETHTFHLTVGEATVTLQDVAVIWGLPVEGEPVTGVDTTYNPTELCILCTEMLGFTPTENELSGARIRGTVLAREFDMPLPPEATELQILQRARICMLLLLGGSLFPDSTSDKVPLYFLSNLRDLSGSRRYSWGSAVLASLYRNLCRAAHKDAKDIGGPTLLLQIWAWERFKNLAPQIKRRGAPHEGCPLGARWEVGNITTVNAPLHVLTTHRSSLQSLRPEMFVWTPYTDYINGLPDICTSGHRSWRSECWLIHWEVVELHLPGRVLRQFGIRQGIPPAVPLEVNEHYVLHSITRAGRGGHDWSLHHQQCVDSWNNRHHNRVDGEHTICPLVAENYMGWYYSVSISYISNPTRHSTYHGFQDDGSFGRYMADGMTYAYHATQDYIDSHPESSSGLSMVGNTIRNIMGLVGQEDRLAYPSNLTTQPMPQRGGGTAPQRARRRRNAREQPTNLHDEELGLDPQNFRLGPPLDDQTGTSSHMHVTPAGLDQSGPSSSYNFFNERGNLNEGNQGGNFNQSYNQTGPPLSSPFSQAASWLFDSDPYTPTMDHSQNAAYNTPSMQNAQGMDWIGSLNSDFNVFGNNSENEQNRFANMSPVRMDSYGRPIRNNRHPPRCGTDSRRGGPSHG